MNNLNDFSNFNDVDLPGFDLDGLSDLALDCVFRAINMSDNGLCWADSDDLLDILSGLNADNVDDVASRMADLANWCN